MANQEKCRRAVEDVANAANSMFAYRTPATYEEAMAEAGGVAAKIRAELAAKDAMTPEERAADWERWERITRAVRG